MYNITFKHYFIDEISNILRGFREAFWEVADRTERSRARLRLLRQRDELACRESLDYRQLGRAGFELLTDGVSVTRTPDTAALLDDIHRLIASQRETDRKLVADLIEFSQHDWQRLVRQLEHGESVFRSFRLGGDTTESLWMVGATPPPGMCLAVIRNEVLHQMSEGLGHQSGDILLAVVPVSVIPEWEVWSRGTSTVSVDELGTTVLKTLT